VCEISQHERECEICNEIMKFREVFSKQLDDVQYFYVCENVDCIEYDENKEAIVYYDSGVKVIE